MRPLRLRLCELRATTWFPDSPADALVNLSRLGSWKRCVMRVPVSSWEFPVLSDFRHSPFTPQITPHTAESVHFTYPYALIK
jgi:hypothetical protein